MLWKIVLKSKSALVFDLHQSVMRIACHFKWNKKIKAIKPWIFCNHVIPVVLRYFEERKDVFVTPTCLENIVNAPSWNPNFQPNRKALFSMNIIVQFAITQLTILRIISYFWLFGEEGNKVNRHRLCGALVTTILITTMFMGDTFITHSLAYIQLNIIGSDL